LAPPEPDIRRRGGVQLVDDAPDMFRQWPRLQLAEHARQRRRERVGFFVPIRHVKFPVPTPTLATEQLSRTIVDRT